jgi:hypothetical protein
LTDTESLPYVSRVNNINMEKTMVPDEAMNTRQDSAEEPALMPVSGIFPYAEDGGAFPFPFLAFDDDDEEDDDVDEDDNFDDMEDDFDDDFEDEEFEDEDDDFEDEEDGFDYEEDVDFDDDFDE